ncbi:MAG TPA: polymer-forming cytoskeletal protein [Polyangiales bacterium]
MFGSKASSAAEVTVIGRGAVIEGTIRAQGRIQVDGKVEGSLLVQGQVSVGPTGSVVGEVVADELVVGGRLEGKVTARTHLHVVSGGSVQGQAHYASLQVDRGGVLHGTTTQGDAEVEAASAKPELSEGARMPAPPPLPAQVRAPVAAT